MFLLLSNSHTQRESFKCICVPTRAAANHRDIKKNFTNSGQTMRQLTCTHSGSTVSCTHELCHTPPLIACCIAIDQLQNQSLLTARRVPAIESPFALPPSHYSFCHGPNRSMPSRCMVSSNFPALKPSVTGCRVMMDSRWQGPSCWLVWSPAQMALQLRLIWAPFPRYQA